jgi:hypothetical protein
LLLSEYAHTIDSILFDLSHGPRATDAAFSLAHHLLPYISLFFQDYQHMVAMVVR